MDIPAHRHGRRDGLDVGLLHEEGPHDEAEVLHVGFGEVAALLELGEVEVWIKVHGGEGGREGREGERREVRRRRGGERRCADGGVGRLKEGSCRFGADGALVLEDWLEALGVKGRWQEVWERAKLAAEWRESISNASPDVRVLFTQVLCYDVSAPVVRTSLSSIAGHDSSRSSSTESTRFRKS